MTATDELLPCPFCGGKAELRYHPMSMRDPQCRAWEVGCSLGGSMKLARYCTYCGKPIAD